MAAGCVTVPAYVTNTERDHVHILDNSGARAVIVSNEKLLRPLHPAIPVTGIVEHVIGIEDLRRQQSGSFEVHSWQALTAGDAAAARKAVEARIARLPRHQPAIITHTSPPSGRPPRGTASTSS